MRALIHALCCSDRRSRGPFTSESLALHEFTFHSSRSGIPPEYHRQDVIFCHTLMYSAKQLPGNVLMFSMRFVWSLTCYSAANMFFDACELMHQLQGVRAGDMIHDHIPMDMHASLQNRSAVLPCLFQATSTGVHQVAHLPSR